MPKNKDLTNTRFGRLVALMSTEERRDGSVVWKCQCDCGKIKYVSARQLRRGTQSCGCLQKEIASKTKTKDISNQRFGKLIAVKPTTERKHGSIIWECLCDCGNSHFVSAENLLGGNCKSCGCLHSVGNSTIKKILNSLQENFACEYAVRINSTTYYYDFVLFNKDNSVKCLIEYDGILHYSQDKYHGWNNEENWFKTQKNDIIKNNWCKENNIPLIRIPYTDLKILNENYIKEIIKNVQTLWLCSKSRASS